MLEKIHPREARTEAAEGEFRNYIHFAGNGFEYAEKHLAFAACLKAIATNTPVQPAEGRANDVATFLADLKKKHRLRDGELLRIIGDELSRDAKYIIRQERHKRSDKSGGLA